MAARAIRGTVARFCGDPFGALGRKALVFDEDQLILIEASIITAVGPAETLLPGLAPDIPVDAYPGAILAPGFIDAHDGAARHFRPCRSYD